MPLEPPVLDDLTFDRVKRLALLRIPRYTPEWTDFNESDPGVTLIDLFAWLTELLGYRMNRLPERNYLKFLQLLGMDLEPAQPAVTYLTFTPTPGADTGSVPLLSQVTAQAPGAPAPLIFETTDGLDLIRLPLTRVLVFDSGSFSDVTAANNAPGKTPIRPFGWQPQVGNALYLGFADNPQTPARKPLFPLDMRWHVFLPAEAQAGQPVICHNADAPAPPVNLVWEYRVQENPPRWERLQVYHDESLALTREGGIQVQGPGRDFVEAEARGQDRMYWLRVRLDSGSFPGGRAPQIDFIRPNVVAAENLSTVREEFVDTSKGTPDQAFTLRFRPVIPQSLVLNVPEQDQTIVTWNLKPDFLASGPDDPDYVLNATTGEIRFGDGQHGRIPVAGSQIVATKYRYGGGAAGNIPANVATTLPPNTQGIDKVTNERAAACGRDEQTLDDFKQAAPALLRHRNRAVSAADYAELARATGGIAKATAIALAHPDYPGVQFPGAVTVVVVPDTQDVPPQPSQNQLDAVCRQLDAVRLLTTEVYVRRPEYHPIKVQARVQAQPYAAFDDVARQVNTRINDYLSPLGRTPSYAKSDWQSGSDFGASLFPTSLYNIILDVPDVKAVPFLSVTRDGIPHDNVNEPVNVPPWGMVYGVAQHDIQVEPFQPGS